MSKQIKTFRSTHKSKVRRFREYLLTHFALVTKFHSVHPLAPRWPVIPHKYETLPVVEYNKSAKVTKGGKEPAEAGRRWKRLSKDVWGGERGESPRRARGGNLWTEEFGLSRNEASGSQWGCSPWRRLAVLSNTNGSDKTQPPVVRKGSGSMFTKLKGFPPIQVKGHEKHFEEKRIGPFHGPYFGNCVSTLEPHKVALVWDLALCSATFYIREYEFENYTLLYCS